MSASKRFPSVSSDRMTRRALLAGLAVVPITAAQSTPARSVMPTVAHISLRPGGREDPTLTLYRESIVEGLAAQGYVPSRDFRWSESYAESREDVEPLARKLAEEGPDLIVSIGLTARSVIAGVAGRVPVVYGYSGDPVAAGIADGLSRPRGNATGFTLMHAEINAKRIELLKELVPSISRLALISSPTHPGEPAEIAVCRRAAASIGIDMTYMPVFNLADTEVALAQAASEGCDALAAPPDAITRQSRGRFAAWALERGIPFASGWAMFAESGGLMTYGPNVRDSYRRVGHFAARVLSGTRPADLPIERPSRFELVINLKTARALGIAVPSSILVSADVVIE